MHNYKVSSIDRHKHHLVLSLRPASGQTPIDFLPGQYATISFVRGSRLSPARCFSFVNSPSQTELKFAMRPHGRFTRRVAKLAAGTAVKVQGPYGRFTIDAQFDRQIIMLAGGIGITPLMSLLKAASEDHLPNPITLLYACRTTDDIPFYDELIKLSKSNRRLKVYFLVDQAVDQPDKRIYKRRLSMDLINQINHGQPNDYSYFVCGPKGFSDSFSQKLAELVVEPERVVAESFTQATKLGWNIGLFKPSISSLTYTATSMALIVAFGFFMVLDLVRYVPKVEAKSVNNQANVPTTSDTNNTSSGNSQDQASTNQSNSPSTGSSTYSQSYSPPVTTVS